MKKYTAVYVRKEGFADSTELIANNIQEAKNRAQSFKQRNGIKGVTIVRRSK